MGCGGAQREREKDWKGKPGSGPMGVYGKGEQCQDRGGPTG